MFNSINTSLNSKPGIFLKFVEIIHFFIIILLVHKWDRNDVSDQLDLIGLGEYAEQFEQNHIDGKNLLDITK